jgi:8-oxo-dGTP diphosphatase
MKLATDTIIEKDKQIILIKRNNPPFQGRWAIPGGLLKGNETVEQCSLREALEETGFELELTGIVGVFSKPGRDPRGRTVSVCFSAKPVKGELRKSDEGIVAWFPLDSLPALAFDHDEMMEKYLKPRNA